MKPEDMLIKAQESGYLEILPGCYLSSKDDLQEEQPDWGDEDKSDKLDFSSAPYWVTTDTGAGPFPVHDVDDLKAIIDNY